MTWLMPSAIATMAGTALLALMFYYLYFVDRNEYLVIWAISWTVYFIRFIRGDSLLKLHAESFKVNQTLRYSYVVAEANIDTQSLIIRQNNEIVQTIPFKTPVDW